MMYFQIHGKFALGFDLSGRAKGSYWSQLSHRKLKFSFDISRVSNIESDNSQNVGLEDYNNTSDGIFPHFTTPSIRLSLG